MSFTVPGYTVYERLGTGARSTIWLVADQRTGDQFALKRVVKRATDDNRYLVQAINDYDVSAKLDHPYLRRSFNMRKVRKFLQVRELHIIMEYFDGRSLEEIGPLGTHGLLNIFIRVAHGLDALHQCGYVHADIKPNNILVGQDGDVRVIDFGQSCRIGHVKGRIQGTPDYIAPEQVEKGVPLDKPTDVFNFGATLYWAITGKAFPTVLPSRGWRTGIELAKRREAVPPQEINPNVPTALSRLVMDCCKTNPKDRPPDMREVLHRLEVTKHILDKNESSLTGPAVQREKDSATNPQVPASPGDSRA